MNERLRKMLLFGIVRTHSSRREAPVEVDDLLTRLGHRFLRIIDEVRRLQDDVDDAC